VKRCFGLCLSAAGLLALDVIGTSCSVFAPSNNIPAPNMTTFDVHPIRVNTVGYVTSREKLATVVLPDGMTSLANAAAEVHTASDGALVWPCYLIGPTVDPDTNLTYYIADFSPFDQAGEFYVAAPGLTVDGAAARSATFDIAPDVFKDVVTTAMLGMYGQRCGTAVSLSLDSTTWSHKACHGKDAYLTYLTGADSIHASTGGWHDAGDYGKYVTNGAFSVGMMLQAWEMFQPALASLSLPIPEHGNSLGIPDYLSEVKWELDWLLNTQDASGGVPHKLTGLVFEGFVMPDVDTQKRYFTGIGTAATANFVAVMAEAARIYATYDPTSAMNYRDAAASAYAYLTANTGPAIPANNSMFTTGAYKETDPDNRIWAAAEMWETTGDPAALADFETRAAGQMADTDFDWPNVQNLGIYTYLLSQRSDKDMRNATLLASLSSSVVAAADTLSSTAAAHAFGRALGGSYYWGSNGSVARAAMNLSVANVVSPNDKYLDTIAMQLDFLLGRNAYDRSQVTALGYNPPVHPHHRPSASDSVSAPWPGLLVGGANSQDATAAVPAALTWQDSQSTAELNEIAINWNAALIYAAAALTPAPAP
jgi:endoglucanase